MLYLRESFGISFYHIKMISSDRKSIYKGRYEEEIFCIFEMILSDIYNISEKEAKDISYLLKDMSEKYLCRDMINGILC